VVSPVRTPVGGFGGALRPLTAEQLAAFIIQELIRRTGLDSSAIDEVIAAQSYASSEAPCLGRYAALAAGLFPKLLIVEKGKMQTLGNSQPVAFHPSSVNFKKRPEDIVGGGTCLMYFTLMYVRCGLKKCELTWSVSRHSKKLYVWETSPINDHALLLLCGDVEFKVRPLSPSSR